MARPMKKDLQAVTVEILDTEEWGELENAIDNVLTGLMDVGRCKTEEYACEGTSEQCAENPARTFYVAMLTSDELSALESLATKAPLATVARTDVDATADGPPWNPAIYYCGEPSELPCMQREALGR